MILKDIAYTSKASQEGFELWQMLKAVQEIKPKVILEVGVHKGGGLETYMKTFPTAHIIGVDNGTWPEQSVPKGAWILRQDSQVVETAENFKTLMLREWGVKEVDFLFIDGDHTYEGVKKDYEIWSPLVRDGGIIGFHDTNNRGIEGVEVDKFLAELDDKYSFSSLEIRAHKMSPGTRLIWI